MVVCVGRLQRWPVCSLEIYLTEGRYRGGKIDREIDGKIDRYVDR